MKFNSRVLWLVICGWIALKAHVSGIQSSKSSTTPPICSDRKMLNITIVGAGNWGTAVARRVALNLLDAAGDTEHPASRFNTEVCLSVYEEQVNGRPLSEIINTDHENVKYLKGVRLPDNVVAEPNLIKACSSADVLFFIIPHQFLPSILTQIKGHVKSDVVAVTMIKGLSVCTEGPMLLSAMIEKELSLSKEVAVVMGANIASEVAEDQFVEATVASRDPFVARLVVGLLDSPCFRTSTCTDVVSVEICGALKNIIALGAGFCDAMELGYSAKAAVLRKGITEMMDYCKMCAGPSFERDTVLESCGIADVIATSFAGRNRKCAEVFARRLLEVHHGEGGNHNGGSTAPLTPEAVKDLWQEIEAAILGGQKMQGVLTSDELVDCLRVKGLDRAPQEFLHEKPSSESYAYYIRNNVHRNKLMGKVAGAGGSSLEDITGGCEKTHELRFGLFARIYAISHGGESPMTLFDW